MLEWYETSMTSMLLPPCEMSYETASRFADSLKTTGMRADSDKNVDQTDITDNVTTLTYFEALFCKPVDLKAF